MERDVRGMKASTRQEECGGMARGRRRISADRGVCVGLLIGRVKDL